MGIKEHRRKQKKGSDILLLMVVFFFAAAAIISVTLVGMTFGSLSGIRQRHAYEQAYQNVKSASDLISDEVLTADPFIKVTTVSAEGSSNLRYRAEASGELNTLQNAIYEVIRYKCENPTIDDSAKRTLTCQVVPTNRSAAEKLNADTVQVEISIDGLYYKVPTNWDFEIAVSAVRGETPMASSILRFSDGEIDESGRLHWGRVTVQGE